MEGRIRIKTRFKVRCFITAYVYGKEQFSHICMNRSAFTFTFNSPLILSKM
jgi:hypothetical protein